MRHSKNQWWINVSLWSILLLCLAFLFLHVFSFTRVSQKLMSHRVQSSIARSDDALHASMNDFLDSFPLDSVDVSRFYHQFQSSDPSSVLFFKDDSLVFWNSNLLEPRLVRKRVPVGCDTLVHFVCGDFLFSSASTEHGFVYFYRLLNTTYPFENEFFVNKFQDFFFKQYFSFSPTSHPNAFPVYSNSGKILAYCQIDKTSSFGFSHPALLVVSLMIVVLCVFLLAFRKIRLKNRGFLTSSGGLALVPCGALLLFFSAVVLGFRRLFHYGFSKDFFIPSTLSVDWVLFWFFVAFLLMVTSLLLLRSLFIRCFPRRTPVFLPLALYVLCLGVISWMLHLHWVIFLLGVLILVLFLVFSHYGLLKGFLFMMAQLLLWGVLLTDLYDQEYTSFENQKIKTLAKSLADERDPDFEQSYHHFITEIQHDTSFFAAVLSDDIMDEVAEDYMRNFLFDSVMNNYNVKLTLCVPGAELEVQPEGVITDCMGYFQDKFSENHGIDLGDGLSFLDYHSLDPSYLSMISILINDTVTDMSLFIEFTKPVAPQGFGLPGLLQHGSQHSLLNSSVACYQDSLLVYKYGSYVYPNYLSDYKYAVNDFSYGRKMKHYAYQDNPSKLVAITLDRRGWMEVTTPFVFFFFFLLVLFLLLYMVGGLQRNRFVTSTLSSKYQGLVLLALGLSFFIVGPVSVIYMHRLYTQKANDYHFERTRSLLQDISTEVDFSFMKHQGFNYELDRILKHYSETFYTDINIYGLNGRLLATTSPELQDLHLQASLMNAEAFHNMRGERSLYYIHNEQLGKAEYPSAYIAIQDDEGKTLAYLNTPYFSSRSGLRKEIVSFVLTYINIILLIILLFLPVVLIITRKVTYPLVQLQAKMRKIDINKSNELLEWNSKDEIGVLVNQYNQLVIELEKSAAELRRTTTESAWRGVARQVAHEIKNSLTPMRLSVQMLQRSVEKQEDDEVKRRVLRTSNTLIEQIDALSDIASSFSSYAKLPENHPQPFDLAELVGNVVHLYDHVENIVFNYDYDEKVDFTYNGDKTNLNSAISNIVKNATQAIGSMPDGRIDVRLSVVTGQYRISIRDNGKGIKEEDKKMIFLPNFTTKSGGSGVGLSLTYNIILSAGGQISFESEEGKGAEFIIELPQTNSIT